MRESGQALLDDGPDVIEATAGDSKRASSPRAYGGMQEPPISPLAPPLEVHAVLPPQAGPIMVIPFSSVHATWFLPSRPERRAPGLVEWGRPRSHCRPSPPTGRGLDASDLTFSHVERVSRGLISKLQPWVTCLCYVIAGQLPAWETGRLTAGLSVERKNPPFPTRAGLEKSTPCSPRRYAR